MKKSCPHRVLVVLDKGHHTKHGRWIATWTKRWETLYEYVGGNKKRCGRCHRWMRLRKPVDPATPVIAIEPVRWWTSHRQQRARIWAENALLAREGKHLDPLFAAHDERLGGFGVPEPTAAEVHFYLEGDYRIVVGGGW